MTLLEVTNMLQASGPWGLVAVLGWAFWRVQNRKDNEVKGLYERIGELCEKQISATIRMESSIKELTASILSMPRTHKG